MASEGVVTLGTPAAPLDEAPLPEDLLTSILGRSAQRALDSCVPIPEKPNQGGGRTGVLASL